MTDKSKSLQITAGTQFNMTWSFPMDVKITTTIKNKSGAPKVIADASSSGNTKPAGVTLSATFTASGGSAVPADFTGSDPVGAVGAKDPNNASDKTQARWFKTTINTTGLAAGAYVFLATFDNGNTLTANVQLAAGAASSIRDLVVWMVDQFIPATMPVAVGPNPNAKNKDFDVFGGYPKRYTAAECKDHDAAQIWLAQHPGWKNGAEGTPLGTPQKSDAEIAAMKAVLAVPRVTSCGQLPGMVMSKLQVAPPSGRSWWGPEDVMAAAKDLGIWVTSGTPKPGDIYTLRYAATPSKDSASHIGVMIDTSSPTTWKTGDTGQGTLPTQTGAYSQRTVSQDGSGNTMLKGASEPGIRRLGGWLDLDQLKVDANVIAKLTALKNGGKSGGGT